MNIALLAHPGLVSPPFPLARTRILTRLMADPSSSLLMCTVESISEDTLSLSQRSVSNHILPSALKLTTILQRTNVISNTSTCRRRRRSVLKMTGCSPFSFQVRLSPLPPIFPLLTPPTDGTSFIRTPFSRDKPIPTISPHPLAHKPNTFLSSTTNTRANPSSPASSARPLPNGTSTSTSFAVRLLFTTTNRISGWPAVQRRVRRWAHRYRAEGSNDLGGLVMMRIDLEETGTEKSASGLMTFRRKFFVQFLQVRTLLSIFSSLLPPFTLPLSTVFQIYADSISPLLAKRTFDRQPPANTRHEHKHDAYLHEAGKRRDEHLGPSARSSAHRSAPPTALCTRTRARIPTPPPPRDPNLYRHHYQRPPQHEHHREATRH